MSGQALQESLSALLDNETDELELRRLLAVSDAGEMRATWARYQVARAVMHKELLLPHMDLAAKVSAALAEEPQVKVARRLPWAGLGRLAVAASVTVAVLAGVRLYNQDDITSTQLAKNAVQPMLTAPHLQGPAILAGYNTSGGAEQGVRVNAPRTTELTWQQQRLPAYVRQHTQQAAATGSQTAVPYARAASLENR
ncbi:MAG: RseA family anti-sigma factor [Pseudomonas sp.]|nr:RseA family anti-sigma factor [Pseudomonas sp.]